MTAKIVLTWESVPEISNQYMPESWDKQTSEFSTKYKKSGERIYGPEGFAVEQFSKTKFSPLSFNHI